MQPAPTTAGGEGSPVAGVSAPDVGPGTESVAAVLPDPPAERPPRPAPAAAAGVAAPVPGGSAG
eukprot:15412812-Alexandrium_andersonii.AAC.1